MKINKNILLFGEDIEFPYGGAFNVTQDLSHLFKGRVFNMPDSEAAIIGFGNGVSLANKVPICEIMFGDFMGLTFDQWLNYLEFKQVQHFKDCPKQKLFFEKISKDKELRSNRIYEDILLLDIRLLL